ncbi:hypothetical protein GCM10025777_06120 [Membranihabitans marinus]
MTECSYSIEQADRLNIHRKSEVMPQWALLEFIKTDAVVSISNGLNVFIRILIYDIRPIILSSYFY